ncbi:Gfo/Idh/MocA family oxidoreductase [Cytobacillus firmus]|uniref:Gfo/Idh/MocA family oxidoreductase n=1 Tax=Bacillus sp. 22-7 TaxID=2709707 RepID=UPI0013D2A2C3|nr:Gfo/Idh/MocA family oxidoreductase [Bacillus sp. 22-7]
MSNHLKDILLVGAGNMGIEYAKVLIKMNQSFYVFTRTEKTAQHFKEVVGKQPAFGNLKNCLNESPKFEKAIVAVSIEYIKEVALILMKNGVKEILLEKPGAINCNELIELQAASQQYNCRLFIGYNRRFYESVNKLLEFVTTDNPIQSIHFNFTELSKEIVKSPIMDEVKKNWILANSSHVIDLAFFIAGKPKSFQFFTSGRLSWHPAGSIFVGSGVTTQQILFSYHANWKSPGRWGIEVMTNKNKFFLQPLEKLYLMKHNSFDIEEVNLTNHLDMKFKPGFFKQVQSFLSDKKGLVDLSEQIENINTIYNPIIYGLKQ